jgi:DNA-binding CsgD family transcriptional regulator
MLTNMLNQTTMIGNTPVGRPRLPLEVRYGRLPSGGLGKQAGALPGVPRAGAASGNVPPKASGTTPKGTASGGAPRNPGAGRSTDGRRTKREQPTLQEGLLLMNQTLERVALDRGAQVILNHQTPPGGKSDPASCVPKSVMDLIRRSLNGLLPVTMYFGIGGQEYIWRAYWMDSQNGFIREPLVVLHVEKVVADRDTVYDVAGRHNLTDRERETLRGISRGLTSKELAQMMGISPNTVKAFLRMIMIKMGVTTRAGIVASLLQSATLGEQHQQASAAGKTIANEEESSAPRSNQVAGGRS